MTGSRAATVRVTACLVAAGALHLAILLSRVPVGATRIAPSMPDLFELVDIVAVPSETPASAATPPVPVVASEPEVAPPMETEDVETAAQGVVEVAGSDEEPLSEAALIVPKAETGAPEALRPGRSSSRLDPGSDGEAGAAGPAPPVPSADRETSVAGKGDELAYLPLLKVDRKPVFVRRGSLRYPEGARRLGLSAVVVVEADIDAAGVVRAVRVTAPAGHGFDEAAEDMVRTSTFAPAQAGGRDVPVRARFTIIFRQK